MALKLPCLAVGTRFPLPLDCGTVALEESRLYIGLPGENNLLSILVVPNEIQEDHRKEVEILRRLGRVLNLHQHLKLTCEAASHALRAEFDLAAVAIWACDHHDDGFRLVASVGMQRSDRGLPELIRMGGGTSCLAELSLNDQRPLEVVDVKSHILGVGIEQKLCYVEPGSAAIYPLFHSGTAIGVVEFVGRAIDAEFWRNVTYFEEVVEHLALAINSAMMYEKVERLASHDPLTGLANHRRLQEFLSKRCAEAERNGTHLSVAMIDVDHFRLFNEEEGHDAGDAVLKLVGETLEDCLRPYDLAARYGGEEFTIVMPGGTSSAIASVAERMRSRVEEIPYFSSEGERKVITISIGCATLPSAARDTTGLLKAADRALYRAKRLGRNRVETARPSEELDKSA